MLNNLNLKEFIHPKDVAGHWREIRDHELSQGKWSEVLATIGHNKSTEQKFVDRKPPFLEISNCCNPELCQDDIISQVWFTNSIHHDTRAPIEFGRMIDFEFEGGEIGTQKGWSAFNAPDYLGFWTITHGNELIHLNSRQLLTDGNLYTKYSISTTEGEVIVDLDRVYRRLDLPARAPDPFFAFNCDSEKVSFSEEEVHKEGLKEEAAQELKDVLSTIIDKGKSAKSYKDLIPNKDAEAVLNYMGKTYEISNFDYRAFNRLNPTEAPKPTPEPKYLIKPTPEPKYLIKPTPEPKYLIKPTPEPKYLLNPNSKPVIRDELSSNDEPSTGLLDAEIKTGAKYLDEAQERMYLERKNGTIANKYNYVGSHPCWDNKNIRSVLPCIMKYKKKKHYKRFLSY